MDGISTRPYYLFMPLLGLFRCGILGSQADSPIRVKGVKFRRSSFPRRSPTLGTIFSRLDRHGHRCAWDRCGIAVFLAYFEPRKGQT